MLTLQFLNESVETRLAALRWILMLHIKSPEKIFALVEEVFPALLKTLSDPSDEVVSLDLEVLAEISSTKSPGADVSAPAGKKGSKDKKADKKSAAAATTDNLEETSDFFTKFMMNLLAMFSTDRDLLEKRGSFIIRQLCLLLHPERIYQTLANILLQEEDLEFASLMVGTPRPLLSSVSAAVPFPRPRLDVLA